MAPRVTRAAARADPVLADETQQVVEEALTEAGNTSRPASPSKHTRRAALGEVTGNDTLSAPPQISPRAEVVPPTSDENADIVLYIDSEKSPKKSRKNSTSPRKRSPKKGRGTASRSTLKDQFGEALESFTQRGLANRRGTNRGFDGTLADLEDDQSTSRCVSEGSENVSDDTLLQSQGMVQNRAALSASRISYTTRWIGSPTRSFEFGASGTLILFDGQDAGRSAYFYTDNHLNDDFVPTTPSRQAWTAKDMDFAVDELDARRKETGTKGADQSDDASRAIEQEKKSETVQKLCSLFEPPTRDEQAGLASPALALPAASPIDVMDAFENEMEAVEAAEASLQEVELLKKDAKRRSATMSPRAQDGVTSKDKVGAQARDTRSKSEKARAKGNRATGSNEKRASIAVLPSSAKPSIPGKARPRSEIISLNTPPQAAKSNKPVTVPSFQLPGEAIAAKHKAAKEEREKRREQEELKKKEALKNGKPARTIRPLPKAPRPSYLDRKPAHAQSSRPSIISSAAAANKPLVSSRIAGAAAEKSGSEATHAIPRAAQVGTMASTARVARSSKPADGTVKHSRPSIFDAPTQSQPRSAIKANMARPRARAAVEGDGSDDASKSNVHKLPVRERPAKVDPEKEMRARLEALKRAKEEATQRGRAAAAAWAEKNQKKRVVPLPSGVAV